MFYTAAIILLAQSAQAEKRVDIVLVGATGNLAKKYLWQSLFRLYKESLITPESPSFVVWPAASKSAKTASDMLEEILERNVECVLGVDYVVEEDIAIHARATGTTSSRGLSDRTFSCEKTSITRI